MQEERGIRKQSSRCSGAQPLADLQHNVLSGHSRPAQIRSSSSGTGKGSNLNPDQMPSVRQMQKWLKALGLSQYAASFAREEIDEDALVCLTSHDLRSIGVTNIAHQRLILSAALQMTKPATIKAAGTVNAPADKASGVSSALAENSPSLLSAKAASDCMSAGISPSALPKAAAAKDLNPLTLPNAMALGTSDCQVSTSKMAAADSSSTAVGTAPVVQSTTATLPIKPLPGGGLHSIATAVALRQVATANANAAKLQLAPAGAQHLRTANNLQPVTHKQLQSQPAKSSGEAVADAAHSKTVGNGSQAGCNGNSTVNRDAASTVAGHASGRATTHVTQPGNQDATAAAARQAGSTAESASSAAAGTSGRQTIAPAPSSKNDEARQLALALSASLGQPTDDGAVLSQAAAPSSAASQGVFMTMMAASRQKANSTTLADAMTPPLAEHSCSRQQETALLHRLFSNCPASVSCTGSNVLQATGVQGPSQSQAKKVDAAEALWTSACLSEPPACCLPQRVQKRKAEADLQRQKAKQQALEQQRLAANAALASSSKVAQESQTTCAKEDGAASHSTGVCDSDCIVLDSPVRMACQDEKKPGCSQTHCVDSQTSQTMDPMKRMRLQALQQELVAAKQTVADLERMIRTEQLS